MIEFLKNILSGHNEFASGGLLLMILGGLGVYLRAVPESLWEWFVSQTTMMVTVKDDASFEWVKEWFLEQKFLKRVRRVDLDTSLRGEKVVLVPAPGAHWFWYGGRPFVVYFYRNESKSGSWQKYTETITLRTVGRRQAFLKRFVKDVVECHESNARLRTALYVFDDSWDQVVGYVPRILGSVILKSGEMESLIRDIERFKASRDRYRQLGVPYHRGYLFYGPPGTGKSSLASALARKFGMSIYALSLSEFTDRTLAKAINEVPRNSLILFEDIDCMKSGRARAEIWEVSANQAASAGDKRDAIAEMMGVTLSGLLNVLDGSRAPEGVIYVMTTNRIEALDPAMLRPGRIDYRLLMGEATEEQKVELYRRFFPSASEIDAWDFVETHRSAETMADFQGLLLKMEQNLPSSDLECRTKSVYGNGNRS